MNKMTKIVALVLVAVMMMAMSLTAIAEPGTPSITIKPNDTQGAAGGKITIKYTYYKILSADIDTDPIVATTGEATTDGVVAYYVTDSEQAAAIDGLKTEAGKDIFNVTRVEGQNKWYVELNKETNASADDIVKAFNDETFLGKFTEQTYNNTAGGDAVITDVSAGYYFIKSSLGSKMAVQTLSPVTINEKNQYVTDDKTIPEDDKDSQIGKDITYTLTVEVPATATEQIVLTDTMSKGLTFKEIKSQKINGTNATDAQKGEVSSVSAAENEATKFTITYTSEQVKALVASGSAATITVEVTVTVNSEAAIDTDIPNTLDLKYGNNYDAVPKTVNTKTTHFTFDKVDGTDSTTKLTGAEFQLLLNGTLINLVEVKAGEEYRIATDGEATKVEKMVTKGSTITVNGLDADLTYTLKEIKAPTGYNIMSPDSVSVKAENGVFVHQNIENNKGAQLPSTGGVGTTMFYIIGALLVVGAGILLVTKRRMGIEK